MNCAIGALLTLLCVCNFTLLLGGVFDYSRKKSLAPFLTAAGLCTAAGGAVGLLFSGETAETLIEVLLMVCSMGLPYLLFEHKKKMTFVWVGLTLCSLFDFFEYAAVSLFAPMTLRKTLIAYTALYAAACAVSAAAGRFIRARAVPDFPEHIPPIVFIVIFAVNYSAYYSLTVINSSESYAGAAVVMNYLSAALSACCIGFVIYRFAVLSRRRREEENIHALELKRYEEMIRGSNDMRAFRHDYKNNLHALEALINAGRTDEAREYISSLTDSLDQTVSRYQTGNILADAILSDKAAAAEASGVTIEFEGIIPAAGIDNRCLCVILSNSLDNAVEACTALAHCRVSVTSRADENSVVLTVVNPVSAPVTIRGGEVRTTKADRSSHGFGIANIRRAAKAHDGYADIKCENGLFTLEAGLVLKAASTEAAT